jgi:DNA-directed RNA polymerase subunit K/omega
MSDVDDFDDLGDIYDVDDDEEDDVDDDASDASDDDEDFDIIMGSMDATDKAQMNARNLQISKMKSGAEMQRVPKSERKTRPVLDRFEFAKIISLRTQQIANGQLPLVDVPKGMTDSDKIANYEISKKKTPFIIVRYLRHAGAGDVAEWWDLEELDNPHSIDY